MAEQKPSRRRRRLVIAAIAFLAVLLALALGPFRRGWLPLPPPPFEADSPDGIEFLGTTPNASGELYSPDGQYIRPIRNPFSLRSVWGNPQKNDTLRRDFHFRVGDDVQIHRTGPSSITDSISGEEVFGNYRQWQNPHGPYYEAGFQALSAAGQVNTRSLVVDLRVHQFYKTSPIEQVDITVKYCTEEGGPALAVFEGPFEFRKEYRTDHTSPIILTLRREQTAMSRQCIGLEVRSEGPLPPEWQETADAESVLRVATRPSRIQPIDYPPAPDEQGTYRYDSVLENIRIEDIAEVRFCERPRQSHFRNITVVNDAMPVRSHAAWLDEMAERLGLDPNDPAAVAAYPFDDPMDAVRILDLPFERLQSRSPPKLLSLSVDSLKPFEREELLAMVRKSVHGPNADRALFLGLRTGEPEFVDPALDYLEDHYSEGVIIASQLGPRVHSLTPTQLDRIASMILDHSAEQAATHHHLFTSLLRQEDPNPSQMGFIARLATCDSPEIWTRIIHPYPAFRKTFEEGLIPPEYNARFAVMGLDDWVKDDPPSQHDVDQLLCTLMTPRLLGDHLQAWQAAFGQFCERLGEPLRTRVILDFLEDYLAERNSKQTLFFNSDSKEPGVRQAIQALNQWHRVDIGWMAPLGDRARFAEQDWDAVARQALRWGETRTDPGRLPAGWIPVQDDLRFVWLDPSQPAKSHVAVWPFDETARLPIPFLPLVDDPDLVAISVLPEGSTHRFVSYAAGNLQDKVHFRHASFSTANLPSMLVMPSSADRTQRRVDFTMHRMSEAAGSVATIGSPMTGETYYSAGMPMPGNGDKLWSKDWQLWIEPAASPDSVLSGTSLFDLWKALYLREGGTETPLPLVFPFHDEQETAE